MKGIIKNIFFACVLAFIFFTPSYADNESINCSEEYSKTGKCPPQTCVMECKTGILIDGCPLSCDPAPCVVISAKDCPLDRCDLLDGCEKGKKVCYYKTFSPPQKCGDLGYAGPQECCQGFVKRCGSAFFDGSCDMVGEHSFYSAPVCVPCGNGICNQFEDQCNCPEDCSHRESKESGEDQNQTSNQK